MQWGAKGVSTICSLHLGILVGQRHHNGQTALRPSVGQSKWTWFLAKTGWHGQAQTAPRAQVPGRPGPTRLSKHARATTPGAFTFTADPTMASGTFNPLSRVLFTLRTLYFVSYRSSAGVQTCEGYTSPFKLQSQTALLTGPCDRGGCPQVMVGGLTQATGL